MSDRESFVSGLEQWDPTERNKSWQIVGDRNTSQQNVVFVLSKIDPDHHDQEARLDVICYDAIRSDTMIPIWQLIVLIVEKFWTVQKISTINTTATADLKIW